ncbi:MAG: hypothetical protein ACRDI3_08540 [Actinomycetota bacterium]
MTVTQVTWTLVVLQAATLFGALFYLGNKIDALGARIDAMSGRIDALSGRIDGLAAQLSHHLADPHPH